MAILFIPLKGLKFPSVACWLPWRSCQLVVDFCYAGIMLLRSLKVSFSRGSNIEFLRLYLTSFAFVAALQYSMLKSNSYNDRTNLHSNPSIF